MQKKNSTSSNLVKLIVLALLGTISFVLMFLSFPLPFLPPYLKIDFSDIPALMAGLIFSPFAGIVVVGVKNILYLIIGTGEPVGVTANFLAGVMFIFPVAYLYHRYKSVKSIISGLITGTLVMAISMSILNYLVILPIYAWFMGMDEMRTEGAMRIAVLAGILPFNIIKGVIVGMFFVPFYNKMRKWIDQKSASVT
ncbi:MAG TPA: ECF transporter S component [Bacillota bacterium]|nr:ECF transporter S component [Bacillota bacterium]